MIVMGMMHTGNIYWTNQPQDSASQLKSPLSCRPTKSNAPHRACPLAMPSVDMHTSSRSLKSVHIPSPVSSASSQSTSLENTSHRVPVQVFEGHKRRVTCVCFYPDEGKLVSGSADRTLRIWDRETGAVKVLGGHTDWVREVDVSRDGKMVVSGSDDKTVRIWEEGSKDATHVLQGHNNSVYSVAFSPDSSRVVSGSSDDTMRVWLIGTGKPAFEPSKCHGHVNCVRYSPSGDKIASGAHSVQIWDAETGLGILLIKNSFVSSLAWTVDGTQVIGGGHRKVTIWNSYNGEHLYNWNAAHMYSNMTLITLSLSPAGTRLATCGHLEKTAFVSDVSSGKQVDALEHDRNIGGIIYSPSGQFIATACNDAKIRLWVAPTDNLAITLCASSFSSFLDRPAIPLTEPSRNDRMALDQFWDSPPSHQQTSPLPQRVFNKVKGMLTSLFARRPADVAQPVTPSSQLRLDHLTQLHIPQNPVRETIEQVEVAGGRDKTFLNVSCGRP
ncbi:WD40 repeat-like protein [Paxillus ammoniavirescens]|nr:WD40 repeat-like protein [Paxillus ammoniavirescens]